jgi:hypothetical protein
MEFNLKNVKVMIGDKVFSEKELSNVELEIERKDIVMIYSGPKGKATISDKGIHIEGGKQ